jgi:hypothetical protein
MAGFLRRRVEGEEGFVDLFSDYLRTMVVRVQLVAEVFLPQSGADVSQGDLLAVTEVLQAALW